MNFTANSLENYKTCSTKIFFFYPKLQLLIPMRYHGSCLLDEFFVMFCSRASWGLKFLRELSTCDSYRGNAMCHALRHLCEHLSFRTVSEFMKSRRMKTQQRVHLDIKYYLFDSI